MATIYSKDGTDAAIGEAIAAIPAPDLSGYSPTTHDHAGDYDPAGTAAGLRDELAVDQITLSGPLALTVPAGFPAGQVYRCAITQDAAGGHTVTYGGNAVAVDLTPGAVTTVEVWPGGTLVYPGASAPAGAVDWSGVTNPPATYAPTAHKESHATGGPDALTPADIGALATSAAPELIRDTMSTALVAGANVTITPNDAGDTITIEAGAGGSGADGMGSMFATCPVGMHLPYFAASVQNMPVNIAISVDNSARFMRVCPVFAKGAYTYDRVTFAVSVPATDANSRFRVALYTSAGVFVKELGTVDATAEAGTKSLVINESLAAGVHWLAIRFDSPTTTGTNPQFYGFTGSLGEIASSSPGEWAKNYRYLSYSNPAWTDWPATIPNNYSAALDNNTATVQMSLRRSA